MIRRPFFAMLGLGAGIAIGIYVTRQARAAQEALRPSNMASKALDGAGGVRGRLDEALAAGRAAAARKEAELRTTYLVADTPPGRRPDITPES